MFRQCEGRPPPGAHDAPGRRHRACASPLLTRGRVRRHGRQEAVPRPPPQRVALLGLHRRDLSKIAKAADEVTIPAGYTLADQGQTGTGGLHHRRRLRHRPAQRQEGRGPRPGRGRRRAVAARPRAPHGHRHDRHRVHRPRPRPAPLHVGHRRGAAHRPQDHGRPGRPHPRPRPPDLRLTPVCPLRPRDPAGTAGSAQGGGDGDSASVRACHEHDAVDAPRRPHRLARPPTARARRRGCGAAPARPRPRASSPAVFTLLSGRPAAVDGLARRQPDLPRGLRRRAGPARRRLLHRHPGPARVRRLPLLPPGAELGAGHARPPAHHAGNARRRAGRLPGRRLHADPAAGPRRRRHALAHLLRLPGAAGRHGDPRDRPPAPGGASKFLHGTTYQAYSFVGDAAGLVFLAGIALGHRPPRTSSARTASASRPSPSTPSSSACSC